MAQLQWFPSTKIKFIAGRSLADFVTFIRMLFVRWRKFYSNEFKLKEREKESEIREFSFESHVSMNVVRNARAISEIVDGRPMSNTVSS